MEKQKNKSNKTKSIIIRVNPDEYNLIRTKALNYPSMSAMLLDSVKVFNDQSARNKIDAINNWAQEFAKFKSELSKIANNINQFAAYVNILHKQESDNVEVVESFNILFQQYLDMYKEMIQLQDTFTKKVIKKW